MNIKKLQLRNTLRTLTLLTFALFTLSACKKDEASNPNAGKTIIKYEVLSSADFSQTPYSLQITYVNGTGQTVLAEEVKTSGKSWSKEVEVTTSQRPIPVFFACAGYTMISPTGTVNVYINGTLRGSSNFTNVTQAQSNYVFSGGVQNIVLN